MKEPQAGPKSRVDLPPWVYAVLLLLLAAVALPLFVVLWCRAWEVAALSYHAMVAAF